LVFSHTDQVFYVAEVPGAAQIATHEVSEQNVFAAVKTAAGQVVFSRLGPADQKKFVAARTKEATTLLEVKSVRILDYRASRKFEEDHPECVLDSLWTERWKVVEGEADPIAKSRWCVVGWQDPDIHEIERSSPMPSDTAINVSAQMMAIRKYKVTARDVKQAFSQSIKSNRRRPLACRQPRTGGFPGAQPGELILLETEVYGLVSGPAWWRVTFVGVFVRRGFVVNPLDRCVLTLPGAKEGDPTQGIALLEMDDVLEGGNIVHQKILADIATEITFGKSKSLMDDPEGVLFNGQRWFQDQAFNITHTISEYVQTRLGSVVLDRVVKPKLALEAPEVHEVQIDSDVPVSCCTTSLPESRDYDWSDVLARQVALTKFPHTVLEDWTSVQDMSTDQLHRPLEDYGQQGPAFITTRYQIQLSEDSAKNRRLNDREEQELRGAIAGLSWSGRQGRPELSAGASIIASSFPEPSLNDARAANSMISHAKATDYALCLWSFDESNLRRIGITDSAFDTSGRDKSQFGYLVGYTDQTLAQGKTARISIVSWKSKKLPRKAGSSLLCEAQAGSETSAKQLWIANLDMSLRYTGHKAGMPLFPQADEPPSVLTRQRRMAIDPHGQLVMDAKALYDMLVSEQQGQDDSRAALQVSLIKDDLHRLGAIPRWVPHDRNPADALTKFVGAHLPPLMHLLKTNTFRIQQEEQELKERSEVRATKGYNPRPHIGMKGVAKR